MGIAEVKSSFLAVFNEVGDDTLWGSLEDEGVVVTANVIGDTLYLFS